MIYTLFSNEMVLKLEHLCVRYHFYIADKEDYSSFMVEESELMLNTNNVIVVSLV